MRKTKYILSFLLLLSLTFGAGFVHELSDNYFEISKNLDIFGKLYREINLHYVDETNPETLIRTGIEAMLHSLDPYTNYVPEEDLENYQFMSTGQYGGIGALVGKREGKMLIIEPYQGYPADRSGLKAGDQIIQVQGTPIEPSFEVSDVRRLLRGEKGSPVSITVLRNDQEQTFSLERARVRINNVPYFGMVDEAIGYISLTGFTQDAGREVQQALLALKEEQPDLKGVILDLRDNPGGRLDEAVNVANVFLPQQARIVETRGRTEESMATYRARRAPIDEEIPLAVLINERSASASEIVAGAIQDLDRGLIIGQRSFGKGLVQNVRPLSYNTQLKITTAKYYTPSGRCIQAVNYKDRDDNGRARRIPDSLYAKFYTQNGRVVFDGGGISPDVTVEDPEDAPVVASLISQGLIFDFATQFALEHPSMAEPRKFQFTDAHYQDFVTFVKSSGFSYETPADREFQRLKATLEAESYLPSLDKELKRLEVALIAQKETDINAYQAEIAPLIEEEIAKRFYYKRGMVEVRFDDDPDILSSLKLLKDQATYQNMLKGNS